MKKIILIASLFISCVTLGQKKQTVDTVYIKTSALCGDCKDRIETALNFEKGVKFAELNLETKVATCVYKPTKVTLAQLRLALVRAGYDADEMKADPEAVKLLPKCCQPGGH
jgi:periplasmic mercuric ion binding protein